jgi:bifunctional N-acetylglucosamine-1-phosphate-uridyltransferase/glucosamine-1-phosphate-acetyltransferase GlmU-like protein
VKQLDLTIVLAAGEGHANEVNVPKVLHQIAGHAIVDYVIAATAPLNSAELRVVVGALTKLCNLISKLLFPAASFVQARRAAEQGTRSPWLLKAALLRLERS